MPPRKKRNRQQSHGASRGHLGEHVRPSRPRQAKPRPLSEQRRAGFGGGRRPYDYAAYEREEATPGYMRRLFAQHEVEVSDRELAQFWSYYDLLRQRNAELDLTRIMGIEATVLKHFIDSFVVAQIVKLEGPLLDIGTGPGFPGVPIAIRHPELHVILAESRGKRVGFLDEVVSTLKLTNCAIFDRSVREDSPFVAATEPLNAQEEKLPMPMPVRNVISRALEVIPGTLQRVQPFLPPGGKVLFMKGPNCGQEVTDAQQQFKGVYRMCDDVRYNLPKTNQQRRLVVFERRRDD